MRALANESDERLLIEAAQQDPRCFGELYENHFERVYAYIARRVHDRDAAEDLTAEVFHQALANIGRFEWRGAPFAAWLFRIAANAIADRWQRLGREGPPGEEVEAAVEADVERRAMLFQLVDSLPPDQRLVVTRRFVDQRSAREIADELGRSEGAVKQLQFRALQTLRARVRRTHASNAVYDELDQAIATLIADSERSAARDDFDGLLALAGDLRHLPRPDFKARLKADLEDAAALITLPTPRPFAADKHPGGNGQHRDEAILPTLFGAGYDAYPVRRANFVVSMLLHAAAVALIATSGLWMVQHGQEIKTTVTGLVTEVTPYVLPPSPDKAGGGGGGGDRDKALTPKGNLPQFSLQQITPPAMVIRNEDPKLAVTPTVVVPPNIRLPQSALNLGDPMSPIVSGPPSNGIGSGGGLGSGTGGGVGSGSGPGVGPGIGGGIGGGVYKVGGGVSAPRAVYSPDPEYSEEARKAKYQGTAILWVVIGPDGRPHDIRVQRSLGMGLDEKAIEAVRTWKFVPAMRDGHPVAVQVNIEVNFRLY